MYYRNARQNGQWRMLARNNRIAPEEIGKNSGYLTDSDKRAFTAIYGGGGGGNGKLAVNAAFEVRARGTSGGEKLNFRIDQNTLATFTLSKDYRSYRTSSDLNGGINVEFFNDGPGCDVQLDYAEVSGQTRQAEAQSYNTGAWGNGWCGGAYSEWMQRNNVLGFGPVR